MSENTPTVSVQAFIRSGMAEKLIQETLKEGAQEFITSLLAVVNANLTLQSCDPVSIIKAGLVAAAMRLPIDPGLGLAYIVPYNNKKKDAEGKSYWVMEAQFQIGAKGFKQLALRTGEYKLINETDVREGEYKGVNRLTGEYDFKWIKRDEIRNKKDIIGYVAFIELKSGYKKTLYMSKEDLYQHADRYSKSYQKGFGNWVDDFDGMARKTVIKLLISRHGIITTTMAKALITDQAAIEEDSYKYIDNDKSAATNDTDSKDDSDAK